MIGIKVAIMSPYARIYDKINIEEMDSIVITGCSAGGLATFYWVQYIFEYFTKINPNINFLFIRILLIEYC